MLSMFTLVKRFVNMSNIFTFRFSLKWFVRSLCSSPLVQIKGTCLLLHQLSATYDSPRSLFGLASSEGSQLFSHKLCPGLHPPPVFCLVGSHSGLPVCETPGHWCWWNSSYLPPPGLASTACQGPEHACDKSLTPFHVKFLHLLIEELKILIISLVDHLLLTSSHVVDVNILHDDKQGQLAHYH